MSLPEVGELGFDEIGPVTEVGADAPASHRAGEVEKPVGVTNRGHHSVRFIERGSDVLTNWLEQAMTMLTERALPHHQPGVLQLRQGTIDVEVVETIARSNRFSRLDREAADDHCEPLSYLSSRRRQAIA